MGCFPCKCDYANTTRKLDQIIHAVVTILNDNNLDNDKKLNLIKRHYSSNVKNLNNDCPLELKT